MLKEPELISILVYIVLLLSLTREESEEEKYKLSEYIIIGSIVLIVTAGIITALYLEWTSATETGGTEITGVQGRYFTPIILLLVTLIPLKYIEAKNKIEAKWIYIMMILCQLPSLLNMFIYYI